VFVLSEKDRERKRDGRGIGDLKYPQKGVYTLFIYYGGGGLTGLVKKMMRRGR
jgi:hypothetical protein